MIATATNLSTEKKQAVLDEVLASKTFARSDQLRSFLTYVCEKEIAGNGSEINEYVIAVEALGRPATYSSGEEATVRNRAYQLRHKLLEYYSLENATARVRIELPKGSYCPVFVETEKPAIILEELAPAPVTAPALPESTAPPVAIRRARWPFIAALALAVLTVIVFSLSRVKLQKTALEEFWEPVLASAHPALICATQPVVYQLDGQARENLVKRQALIPADQSLPHNPDPNELLKGNDVVAITDQYTGIGTAYATAQITALLRQLNKPSQIKFGNETSFADLRNSPVVLIGAFGNRWTMSIANNFRFVFEGKSIYQRFIVDKADPKNRWGFEAKTVTGKVAEDYVIISRIFQSETGEMLITAAGITQYGTRAAGEFLTNPANFEALAIQAPAGWQKKNLQIVFTVKVLDNTPGPPTILATHFW